MSAPASIRIEQASTDMTKAETEVRLLDCELDVEVLDEDAATFRYACRSVMRGGAASVRWDHDVPYPDRDVRSVRAWDEAGSLRADLVPSGRASSRVVVHLRRSFSPGAEYRFGFAYGSPARTLRTGPLTSTLVLVDGFALGLPCERVRVRVSPPRGWSLLHARFEGSSDTSGGRDHVPGFRLGAEERVAVFAAAYRRQMWDRTWVRWLASAIGTGLVGALIGRALGLI